MWKSLTSFDLIQQTFEASLDITIFAEDIDNDPIDEQFLKERGPMVRITNGTAVDYRVDTESDSKGNSQRQGQRVGDKLIWKIKCSGKFYERFELHDFPLDLSRHIEPERSAGTSEALESQCKAEFFGRAESARF